MRSPLKHYCSTKMKENQKKIKDFRRFFKKTLLFLKKLWYNNLNNGKVGDFCAEEYDRLWQK